MSLVVQKFEDGGTPKKRTTKVGNTEYDLDDFISAIRRNYTKWADSQNFKKDERKAADEAYRDMINELDKGNLILSIDGSSLHSLGRIKNIDKGFDSYGNIQRFLNEILDSRSPISQESKSSSSNKYDPKSGISSWLNQRLFAGRTTFDPNFIDKDSWDGTTRGITNRTNLINPHLEELLKNLDNIYTFDNDDQKNSFKQGLTKLIQALSDGKIEDNEKLELSNLGIDPDTYFFTGESFKTSDDTEEEKEEEKTESDLAQEAYQQSIIDNNIRLLNEQTDLNNLLNSYYQLPEGSRSYSFNGNYKTFDDSNLNENEKQQYGAAMNNLMNLFADYVANNDILKQPDFGRYARSKNKGNLKVKGNSVFDISSSDIYNKHILDTYVQLKNIPKDPKTGHYILKYNRQGYTTMYDLNSGKLYEKRASELGNDYLLTLPEFSNYKVPSNKNGGVLKAQFGAILVDKTLDQVLKEQKEARENTEKDNTLKANPGKTEEQVKELQRKPRETGFTDVDIARMSAAGADITAMLAAFIPGYGTLASGIAGLGSTGANAYADWKDPSLSAGEALKNTIFNLGFDTIGLIPGIGATGKGAKIIRSIVKITPKILMTLETIGVANDSPEIVKSFKKIGSSESLTVQDWQNIARGISVVTGMTKGVTTYAKNKGIRSNATFKPKKTKYSVKTSDGNTVNLTKEQFDQLNKSQSLEDANKLFKSFKIEGAKDKTLKGNRFFNKNQFNTSNLNQRVGEDIYDFDNLERQDWDSKLLNWRYNGVKFDLPSFSLYSSRYTPKPAPTPKPQRKPRTKKPKPAKPTSPASNPRVSTGPGPGGASFNKPTRSNKYGGLLERFKNGGTVRKYDIGGVADWYFKNSTNNAIGTGAGYENLGGWTDTLKKDLAGNYIINTGHSNAGNLVEAFNRNQAYTSNKDLVTKDLQNVYNTLVGTSGNLSAKQFVNLYNANADKIRNFFHNGVNHSEKGNSSVASHNDLFKLMFGNRSQSTNDNIAYNLGWQDNLKDRMGSTTWMRRMDQYENEFDVNNPDENRIHTINYNGQTFQVYKKANGDIGIYTPKDPEVNPKTNPEQIPQSDPQIDPSQIVPSGKARNNNNGAYATLMKFAPNLLASGRLYGTLRTNRSIYNTMKDAMRPMLKNTYELYSPITGAFSEMYLRNREGLKTLAAARRPFTSDASLNTARMLEGQRAFTESKIQGNVVDDKEIKRTEAEARARQEDNIKRRFDLANENRASLLQNYLRLAQLKSDYKLKNWNAINTYLSGIELDARQNWEDYKNWAINTQIQQSTLDLQNKLSTLTDDLRVWQSKNNSSDITDWPRYNEYVRIKRELSQEQLDAQTDIYSRMNWWPYSKSTKFIPT